MLGETVELSISIRFFGHESSIVTPLAVKPILVVDYPAESVPTKTVSHIFVIYSHPPPAQK
jgi:hypothetical protein